MMMIIRERLLARTGFRNTRGFLKLSLSGFYWVWGFIGFFWMCSASGCLLSKHGKGK